MLWTAIVGVFICLLLYHRLHRPIIHRNGQNLRCPPDTLPLLGNAIKFLQPRHVLFDWFVRCQRKFGNETFEISVPTLPPGVVINSPENVEFVLKNEASITKGDFFKQRSWDLFGYGIINATGDLWRAQRKAGLKFFAGANLDALVEEVLPAVYAQTQLKLTEHANTGAVVDMQKVFLDMTTAVVGQMAYDASMDIDASSPFSQAFDYASDHVGLRFQNPFYWVTEVFTGSKFRASLAEVKKFGRQIVANARRRRAQVAFESLITNEEVIFGSLIDSLLETFDNHTIVADAALNFLSAGRDTTAQALTWTLYALLRHPHNLGPLRHEIITKFSTQEALETLAVAALQPGQIPYTTATFLESLRLYPPVPFELKQCEKPITLPDGTSLPTGSIIVWCIWSMNRSFSTYGPDALTFNPTRWLDPSSNATGNPSLSVLLPPKPAHEFPVFNGGPRACLGKKMAELMASYVLVRILSEFDFEEVFDHDDDDSGGKGTSTSDPKTERLSQNSLTLPMEGGLPCRVRRRSWASA